MSLRYFFSPLRCKKDAISLYLGLKEARIEWVETFAFRQRRRPDRLSIGTIFMTALRTNMSPCLLKSAGAVFEEYVEIQSLTMPWLVELSPDSTLPTGTGKIL